ncbi:MAG: hypothetical protein VB853_07740, partial [Pirellulales bacterium]
MTNVMVPGLRYLTGVLVILIASILVILIAGVFPAAKSAAAAEADFVGKLALAVEDDVAKSLGISGEIKEKLLAIIERREEAAIDLVLEIKDLDPATREEKLAPFVSESESLGFKLLTDEQLVKLENFRIKRKGLWALGESAVADKLSLTDDQRKQVERLLEQFDVNLTEGRPEQMRIARLACEQGLSKLMLDEQRAAWEELTEVGGPKTDQPQPSRVAKADAGDQPEPADKPADEPADEPADK